MKMRPFCFHRASVANMLAEVIKGKPCTPIEPPSQNNPETGLDKHVP